VITKLRLDGLEFEINYVENLKSSKGADLYGEIEHDSLKINICKDHPIQLQHKTTIHEILHGLDEIYQLNLKEDSILRLTSALYSTMLDNKELFKEICQLQ
jgi:hypothetical protein